MNFLKRYKIFCLTSIFCLLYSSLLFSQKDIVLNDSIVEKEIKKAGEYLSTNPDSSLIIAKQAYTNALNGTIGKVGGFIFKHKYLII